MNQILYVKNNKNNNSINIKKKKFVFKTQFLFSVILFFTIILIYIFVKYNNEQSYDNYTSQISNNYQVYRLYSNKSNKIEFTEASVIGSIDIPKIDISYPIISNLNEKLLKISPCRFYGDISDKSNLCIAGHNYDNDKFFSKIHYLRMNDQIIITDNNNKKYRYTVFNNYEVDTSDLSPIYKKTNVYTKELTLVTCNNINNKRIIIKAGIL